MKKYKKILKKFMKYKSMLMEEKTNIELIPKKHRKTLLKELTDTQAKIILQSMYNALKHNKMTHSLMTLSDDGKICPHCIYWSANCQGCPYNHCGTDSIYCNILDELSNITGNGDVTIEKFIGKKLLKWLEKYYKKEVKDE